MAESVVFCLACKTPLEAVEAPITPPKVGPVIQMYQCPSEGCQRRAALVFEPVGGMSEEEATWVEVEIARRGSFFPSGSGKRPGGRFS